MANSVDDSGRKPYCVGDRIECFSMKDMTLIEMSFSNNYKACSLPAKANDNCDLLNLQKAQNQGIQSILNTSKALIARHLVFCTKSKEKNQDYIYQHRKLFQ